MTDVQLTDQVEQFAADWFRRLDAHASPEELSAWIAPEGFELKVPEGVFRGLEGFRDWYERALHLFFDEQHTPKTVESSTGPGDDLTVKVVVNWQASTWTPPDAQSRRIKLDAYQTWVLGRKGDAFVIKTYAVDRMEYETDSARL